MWGLHVSWGGVFSGVFCGSAQGLASLKNWDKMTTVFGKSLFSIGKYHLKLVNLRNFKLILTLQTFSSPSICWYFSSIGYTQPPGPPMMVAEVSDTGQMDLLRLLNTQVSESNTGQREAELENRRCSYSESLWSRCWVWLGAWYDVEGSSKCENVDLSHFCPCHWQIVASVNSLNFARSCVISEQTPPRAIGFQFWTGLSASKQGAVMDWKSRAEMRWSNCCTVIQSLLASISPVILAINIFREKFSKWQKPVYFLMVQKWEVSKFSGQLLYIWQFPKN